MTDPAAVLRPDGASEAVAALGDALRRLDYQAHARRGGERGPLVDFAIGRPAAAEAIGEALGPALLDDLVRIGLVRRRPDPTGADPTGADPTVVLAGELVPAGEVVSFAPEYDCEAARIYAGRDTLFLLEILWRTAVGGQRAVDLGAGTGLISAVLARRYRVVVASDLLARAAATALVTRALNLGTPFGSRFVGAIAGDVAGGLRPRAFDLVTANAPWVPVTPADEHGRSGAWRIYALGGGDRGVELPRRFALEGAELVAPGGLLAMLTLDARWADGEEPVADLRRELEARGLSTRVVPTRMAEHDPEFEDALLAALPDLRAARHVALLARRPRTG